MSRGSQRLEIGFVRRAHGIRGELNVVTHDPDSEVLLRAKQVWIGGVAHAVASARPTAQGFLLLLADVRDRNLAELLRGKPLEVARELVPVDDGEVILDDLIGCVAQLSSGETVGTIVAIDSVPMQDRLVIHAGDRELLLPVVDQFVVDINLETGVVIVAPPDGLPDSPIADKAR